MLPNLDMQNIQDLLLKLLQENLVRSSSRHELDKLVASLFAIAEHVKKVGGKKFLSDLIEPLPAEVKSEISSIVRFLETKQKPYDQGVIWERPGTSEVDGQALRVVVTPKGTLVAECRTKDRCGEEGWGKPSWPRGIIEEALIALTLGAVDGVASPWHPDGDVIAHISGDSLVEEGQDSSCLYRLTVRSDNYGWIAIEKMNLDALGVPVWEDIRFLDNGLGPKARSDFHDAIVRRAILNHLDRSSLPIPLRAVPTPPPSTPGAA